MPPRLPVLARLANDLRTRPGAGNQTLAESVTYLANQSAGLNAYEDPQDLGVAADDGRDPIARALALNLDAVRNALVEELWNREIFIDPEIVDELLFHVTRRGEADPLMATLEYLRDRRTTRPGLVLFPLHSLGILGAGLLRGNTKQRAQYFHRDWGLAVSPQTNSLDQTIDFLDRARRSFEVQKPIDPELIRHWRRSRARWLEFNPMLAIRMTTQRGSYFSTERVVLSRVRAAAAQLAMVANFQPSDPDRPAAFLSSSRTNNFETLDIHHYIVFSDNPAQSNALDGDCVPIHARGTGIAELSDLSLEIDPAFRGRKATVAKIDTAVGIVYGGHLSHMWHRRRNAQTRTCDRLFASLVFFLRSFHGGGRSWSAAVSLSTAFEMLLTDSYSTGATARLARRLGLVLRGISGKAGYENAFASLYRARSDLVHAGTEPTSLDLHIARQAFVHGFCVIAPRIAALPRRIDSPMLHLTGDEPAADLNVGP